MHVSCDTINISRQEMLRAFCPPDGLSQCTSTTRIRTEHISVQILVLKLIMPFLHKENDINENCDFVPVHSNCVSSANWWLDFHHMWNGGC